MNYWMGLQIPEEEGHGLQIRNQHGFKRRSIKKADFWNKFCYNSTTCGGIWRRGNARYPPFYWTGLILDGHLKRKLRHAALLVLCFCGPALWKVHAESNQLPEYKVKVAFLYNFTRFIDWPQISPSSDFSVCILGLNPFGEELDAINGKPVKDRKVVTRLIKNVRDIEGCDCLFVSDSEKQNLGDIFRAVGERNVLTVGDMKGFAEAGGVIQFVMQESKIRFFINLTGARRAGLKISSKLLELAKDVKESD